MSGQPTHSIYFHSFFTFLSITNLQCSTRLMRSLSLFPVQLQVLGRQGTVIGLFTELLGVEKILFE